MRFTRLELLHWDIQANQVLVLQPGVNLLTGENGSGKTSILDAVKVVLGGTRIGGDRSVEDYLTVQGAPYAMIRLIADNMADSVTRSRPFDRVQPSEADHFTLAVVYEAGDDGYQPRWYFCPGDVSPLVRGFEGRSFTRKSDYTSRLEKLGMGRSFRKLLCTPQGQVASLCDHGPADLFDLLFDFIGGRQVLEEWEALRRDFDRQQRNRDDRGAVLAEREADLGRLQDRLRSHMRYRDHLARIALAASALPVALEREAREKVEDLAENATHLAALEKQALDDAHRARDGVERLRADEEKAERADRALAEEGRALDARESSLVKDRAEKRARWDQLETLRLEAEPLPVRDLDALQARRDAVMDTSADRRHAQRRLAEEVGALEAERERLEQGLLTPPEGVDDFRAVLRTHDVPHQLLMDLVEPVDVDPGARRALESYLGDFRFAVAVPDLTSFVRATALAREHRFPFYVLAPDVRSRTPTKGAHPFLDRVRVQDPKYRGLVTRVLRGVRWLEGSVETTLRERGTVLVDRAGFVLDRKGGRYQGTERFYLGREALERRRDEIDADLADLSRRDAALTEALAELEQERTALLATIAEERRRREWVEGRPEHRRLSDLLAKLDEQLRELAEQKRRHQADRTASTERRVALRGELERELERQRRAEKDATRHRQDRDALSPLRERADRTLAAAEARLPETVSDEVAAHAARSSASLEQTVESEQSHITGFTEAERDPNLPANVSTLEKQVEAVRSELQRLDAQVEGARAEAERAHHQYKTATRRVFRRYFALLAEAGEPLGFTLEGALRPREDGRFAVDLQVAAGEKDLVPYSSPSLSGGQRAALSMLLAMTTLRVHHDDGGAGFFLVDEPFSASDTYKIQELGTFLARTGAQYIVSMPTTEELRRCGSWLQAVLTCTLTPGGRDAEGRLRLAPPVKCSYVVDRVG
jgi:chromosome segregation ATPase